MKAQRIELPTKEQVNAISDVDALRGLEQEIENAIAKIEVDLTFLTDDEDWHNRARKALSLHKIAIQRIRAQIRRITKGGRGEDTQAQIMQAKAAKKEAAALKQQESNKKQELALQNKAIKAQHSRSEFINRVSYLAAFRRAAQQLTPSDLLFDIYALADDLHLEAVSKCIGEIAPPD